MRALNSTMEKGRTKAGDEPFEEMGVEGGNGSKRARRKDGVGQMEGKSGGTQAESAHVEVSIENIFESERKKGGMLRCQEVGNPGGRRRITQKENAQEQLPSQESQHDFSGCGAAIGTKQLGCDASSAMGKRRQTNQSPTSPLLKGASALCFQDYVGSLNQTGGSFSLARSQAEASRTTSWRRAGGSIPGEHQETAGYNGYQLYKHNKQRNQEVRNHKKYAFGNLQYLQSHSVLEKGKVQEIVVTGQRKAFQQSSQNLLRKKNKSVFDEATGSLRIEAKGDRIVAAKGVKGLPRAGQELAGKVAKPDTVNGTLVMNVKPDENAAMPRSFVDHGKDPDSCQGSIEPAPNAYQPADFINHAEVLQAGHGQDQARFQQQDSIHTQYRSFPMESNTPQESESGDLQKHNQTNMGSYKHLHRMGEQRLDGKQTVYSRFGHRDASLRKLIEQQQMALSAKKKDGIHHSLLERNRNSNGPSHSSFQGQFFNEAKGKQHRNSADLTPLAQRVDPVDVRIANAVQNAATYEYLDEYIVPGKAGYLQKKRQVAKSQLNVSLNQSQQYFYNDKQDFQGYKKFTKNSQCSRGALRTYHFKMAQKYQREYQKYEQQLRIQKGLAAGEAEDANGSRFRSKVDGALPLESASYKSQMEPGLVRHTKGKFSLDFRAKYNPRERKLNRSVGFNDAEEEQRHSTLDPAALRPSDLNNSLYTNEASPQNESSILNTDYQVDSDAKNTAAQTLSHIRLSTQQQLPYRITYSIDGGVNHSINKNNFLSSRLLADSVSEFRLKQDQYGPRSPERRNESRQSIYDNQIQLKVNSESRQRELIQQDINEQHHQINPRYVGEKDECRDSLIHLKGPKYYHQKNLEHFAKKPRAQVPNLEDASEENRKEEEIKTRADDSPPQRAGRQLPLAMAMQVSLGNKNTKVERSKKQSNDCSSDAYQLHVTDQMSPEPKQNRMPTSKVQISAEAQNKKKIQLNYYKPTSLAQQILISQQAYEKDKKGAIKHLCEQVLDKEIQMKPLRLRAAIVQQAVLRDNVDLDVALADYDAFLKRKLEQKIREKGYKLKWKEQLQDQEENELKDRLKQRQEAQMRLMKLKTKKTKHFFDKEDSESSDEVTQGQPKKKGAEYSKIDAREKEKEKQQEILKLEQLLSEDPYQLKEKPGLQQTRSEFAYTQSGGSRSFLTQGGNATELLLKRLGTSNASILNQTAADEGTAENADPQEEKLLLEEITCLNEEYLEMMQFKASLKNTKAIKLTQEETIDRLMQAQQDQEKQHLIEQARTGTSRPAEDVEQIEDPNQYSSPSPVNQRIPLTREQAMNPLNKFYKKEIKKQRIRESTKDPREVIQLPSSGVNPEHSQLINKVTHYHTIEDVTEHKQSLDPSQMFITNKYVHKIFEQMSKIPQNYKAEFRTNRIVMDQEKKLQQKRKREAENKIALEQPGLHKVGRQEEQMAASGRGQTEDGHPEERESQGTQSQSRRSQLPRSWQDSDQAGLGAPGGGEQHKLKAVLMKRDGKFGVLKALNAWNEVYATSYAKLQQKLLSENTDDKDSITIFKSKAERMQHQLKVGLSKKLLQTGLFNNLEGGVKMPTHLATALQGHGSSVNRGQSMTDGAILENGSSEQNNGFHNSYFVKSRDPENEKESHAMHNLAGSSLISNIIGQEMDKETTVPEDFLMKSARNGYNTLQRSQSSAEEASEGQSDDNSSTMSDEFPTLPIDEVKELERMKKKRKRKRRGGVRSSTLPCFARMTAEDSRKAEQLETVAIANDYLQVELMKIWAHHRQNMNKGNVGGPVESEVMTQPHAAQNQLNQSCPYGQKLRNQEVTELFKNLGIEKVVNNYLKKGENRIHTIVQVAKPRGQAQADREPLQEREEAPKPEDEVAQAPVGQDADPKAIALSQTLEVLPVSQVIINHNKACLAEGVVGLPFVFSKIDKNQFILQGYNLNKQAAGISDALFYCQNRIQFIKTLSLDGCCLQDEGFALILKGVIKQDFLESISYSNDELGHLSLNYLESVQKLERAQKTEKEITELNFYALKNMAADVKCRLITILAEGKNLKKFKLSSIDLSQPKVFGHLERLIDESSNRIALQSIDISDTSLRPKQLVRLSELIKENGFVTNLNIGKNNIHPKLYSSLQPEHSQNIETSSANSPQIEEGQTLKPKTKKKVEDEKSNEDLFCTNMAEFIRRNQRLMHINLSKMNLAEHLIVIQEAVAKSHSLLCIHLSNNFVSEQLKFEFKQMTSLISKDADSLLQQQTSKSLYEIEQSQQFEMKTDQTAKRMQTSIQAETGFIKVKDNHRDRHTFIDKNVDLHQAQELKQERNKAFIINQQMQKELQKHIMNVNSNVYDGFLHQEHVQDPQVYSRKLGYPELVFNKNSPDIDSLMGNKDMFKMNAAEQWFQESSDQDCFICNRSILAHIFFRRQHVLEEFEEVTNKMTKKVLFEYYGLEHYGKSKSKLPVILGSATDWKPVKMIPALYHTMLCLTKQMQKSQSAPVLEALPKIREQLEMVLNQPDIAKVDADVGSALGGWSSFLHDHYESQLKDGEAQIFNFPQLYQDAEKVDQALTRHIKAARAPRSRYKIGKNNTTAAERVTKGGSEPVNAGLPDSNLTSQRVHGGQFGPSDPDYGALEQLETSELQDVFVFSELMKPGVQSVIIFDPATKNFYCKQIAVKVREADHTWTGATRRPHKARTLTHESLAARAFRQQMFAEFKCDQAAIMKTSFVKDTQPRRFRPYKFMTDQKEIDACVMLLVREYGAIKDVFLIAASESGFYPNISQDYMIDFCKKNKIMSNAKRHRFEQADLEKIFEETNMEWVEDEADANPDDLLNRSEFLEILMRIAHQKYGLEKQVELGKDGQEGMNDDVESKTLKQSSINNSHYLTTSQGLARILNDVIIPISDRVDIAGFRENRCHNDARVCSTIMKNYVNIQQLYQRHLEKAGSGLGAGGFTLGSAKSMLRNGGYTHGQISDIEIAKCFALSKMTVVDELTERYRYFQLQIVEFYEFLCRVGHHLYNDEILELNLPAAHSRPAPGSPSEPSLVIGVELLLEQLLERIHLKLVRAADGGLQPHYTDDDHSD